MTFMMIALLLGLWAMPVQGWSTNMYNLMTVLNGYYDNLYQYQADNASHYYIQVRCVPVTTPALPGHPVIFIEYALNGEVFNLYLGDLTEDSKGFMYLALYNFTDTSQYKPGEYKLEDLSKLKPENLDSESHCGAEFEPAGRGMYMGTWQTCRHFVNGKHPLYVNLDVCDNIKYVIPRSATEESSDMPYELFRKGDKFPVPNLPNGFVSPCAV